MLVNIGIPEKEISAPVLNAGLEAVTRLNVQLIKSGKAPDFSALIRSGARWAPEPPGQESFDHAGIIARRGWGDCFPQGTLLLRDDYQLVRIEDIQIGERIWSKNQWATVLKKADKGSLALDAIRLNNGSTVLLTGDHHVYVTHKRTGESRVRVSDLQVGEALVQPERIAMGTDVSLDPDRAYVEGLHVADGWYEEERERFRVSGQDGSRKEAQKREIQTICARLGIETNWQRKYITISDPAWAARVALMGHLAPNKHFLSLNLGEAQAAESLRGVMADSAANTHGAGRTFTTTSHQLMVQVRVLHRMFGKSTSIRYMTAQEHGGLGQNPIWRVGVREPVGNRGEKILRVKEIDREVVDLPCWDIQTSDGYVYLPEHDVTVSNCDDWAPTHAASLRASGVDPKARAVVYKSGPNLWHAITQRGDGSLQDPSQTAGMRVRPGSPTQGIPPAVAGSITVVGGDGATPTVALRQAPAGYWVARTDLPMTSGPLAQQGGTLAVRKSAVTPAKALGDCCLGAAVLGGASRYTEREPLDKLYALAGLLRGDGARSVANVVGREAVREAIQTIAEICPQVFEERS